MDWFGLPVNRPIGHFVSRTIYYAASYGRVSRLAEDSRRDSGSHLSIARRRCPGLSASAPRARHAALHHVALQFDHVRADKTFPVGLMTEN